MTFEDAVEDPLVSVQFYIRSKSFSFRVTVHLLFWFSLQKTLKSIFLPRYEFFNLIHDTKYLMTSEDTVEDPLKSVQLKRARVFFYFGLQSVYCFHFYYKTLKSVFPPRYESFKLNHDTNYLMTSEDTVNDLLMSVLFYIKSKSFFILCHSPSTVFVFIAKDAYICISTTL